MGKHLLETVAKGLIPKMKNAITEKLFQDSDHIL